MNTTKSPLKLPVNSDIAGLKFSTNDIPARERYDWLREVICREYTHVEITSPANGNLSQDFIIYPWENLQLSIIQSSAISLSRLPREPHSNSQDVYFVIMLLSGAGLLEQHGREVWLKIGAVSYT